MGRISFDMYGSPVRKGGVVHLSFTPTALFISSDIGSTSRSMGPWRSGISIIVGIVRLSMISLSMFLTFSARRSVMMSKPMSGS